MLSLPRAGLRCAVPLSRWLHATPAASTVYKDTNMPRTLDGRTHHLDVKEGDVANRIVTVGDLGRAERLAQHFDDKTKVSVVKSSRGFVTFTGTFNRVPLSVIATGMGMAMMDFMVRETRAVCEGTMLIVRFGSCGGILKEASPGTVVVASHGSTMVMRDPEGFSPGSTTPPYRLFSPIEPDRALDAQMVTRLGEALGAHRVIQGLNVSACSFYSSQARKGGHFDDRNEELMKRLHERFPNAACMEMETFQLLDLAARSYGSIRATAAAIVLANRTTDKVLDAASFQEVERVGGHAVMRALADMPLAQAH